MSKRKKSQEERVEVFGDSLSSCSHFWYSLSFVFPFSFSFFPFLFLFSFCFLVRVFFLFFSLPGLLYRDFSATPYHFQNSLNCATVIISAVENFLRKVVRNENKGNYLWLFFFFCEELFQKFQKNPIHILNYLIWMYSRSVWDQFRSTAVAVVKCAARTADNRLHST